MGISLLLTGCDATYNLTLENNVITENLQIINNESNSNYKETRDTFLNSALATDYREDEPESNMKQEGIKYYNIKKYDIANSLGIIYESDFTLIDYKYSTIVNANLKEFNYTSNNDGISINITDPIKAFILYPDLNNLTIKFKTNHKVLSNNADKVTDNIYYFYLNKNNYQDKKIILKLSSDYNKSSTGLFKTDDEGYFSKDTLVIIYIFLGFMLIISGGFIYFKVINSNK